MFGLNLYLPNSLSSNLDPQNIPLIDPFKPFVGCIFQSDQVDACRIYDWENNTPEIDGQNQEVFLEFKSSKDD